VRQVVLVAAPDAGARGPLRISHGGRAAAVVDLRPGWNRYVAPVAGDVEGGLTTIVLEPAGHRRPGLFDRERRPLSVAVDRLAFSAGEAGDADSPRGVWPIRTRDGRPGLFVAGASRTVAVGSEGDAHRLIVLSGEASLSRGGVVWSSQGRSECSSEPGCTFELAGAGPSVLRADAAVLTR
jgi:hypothetical protein